MFNRKFLKRIFGPRKEEVAEKLRNLRNELQHLKSSLNVAKMIELRRTKCEDDVRRMGNIRIARKILVRKGHL
jgi:thiamine kinase-like enzyme